MRRETPWLVAADDDGIRPAGEKDRCFYCGVRAGTGLEHRTDCVIRQRTIVVQLEIEYVALAPESWSDEDIYAHRNEGSWCASNGLYELNKVLRHRLVSNGVPEELIPSDDYLLDLHDIVGCGCETIRFSYAREATEAEEVRDGVAAPTTTSRSLLA